MLVRENNKKKDNKKKKITRVDDDDDDIWVPSRQTNKKKSSNNNKRQATASRGTAAAEAVDDEQGVHAADSTENRQGAMLREALGLENKMEEQQEAEMNPLPSGFIPLASNNNKGWLNQENTNSNTTMAVDLSKNVSALEQQRPSILMRGEPFTLQLKRRRAQCGGQ